MDETMMTYRELKEYLDAHGPHINFEDEWETIPRPVKGWVNLELVPIVENTGSYSILDHDLDSPLVSEIKLYIFEHRGDLVNGRFEDAPRPVRDYLLAT
jgi:hypothetical protein